MDRASQPISTKIHRLEWTKWSHFQRFLLAILLSVAATALSALIHLFITSPTNLVMVFLLAVVIAAVYLGRGAAILVSVLGVLSFDFFFVPPRLTFTVAQTEYLLTFIGLFGVGLIISELTTRLQASAEAAQRRETETARLYALSRALATAEGLEEIISVVTDQVRQAFGYEAAVLLPSAATRQKLDRFPHISPFAPGQIEVSAALWAFEQGKPAGAGCPTYPDASACYLPLKAAQGVVGVLETRPADLHSPLYRGEDPLLETFASQAALAIERAQYAERARQTQLLQETEKLQAALLNSISHDLRTPLASITGTLSALLGEGSNLDEETRKGLLETAGEESDRLNRLVGNLLNMTRLQAGAMHLALEPADLQDVIGSALEQVGKYLNDRQVDIHIPDDLPLVSMDFVLMVQVVVNLLDNALKYSPAGTPICLRAYRSGPDILLRVENQGPGIPEQDLDKVFDRFFRADTSDRTGGAGLGLSICKGIVELHGGAIWAENLLAGGTAITISLPLDGKETGK